jgi:CBS domain-containing protein
MGNVEQVAQPGLGRGRVITVGQHERVTIAAQVMHENGVGCLVVVGDDQIMVGIVSERDILRWISTGTPESFSAKVKDIMATHVVACAPGTSIEEAHRLMVLHGIRHLPVVEDWIAVGMISSRDVMCRGLRPTG